VRRGGGGGKRKDGFARSLKEKKKNCGHFLARCEGTKKEGKATFPRPNGGG